jgi:hypothetical protein
MKTATLAIVTAVVVGVAFGTLAATGFLTIGKTASMSTQTLAAEKSGLYGMVHYTLKDKDGNIKYETVVKNLITNGGEDMIQTAFSGGIAAADTIDTICVGTGDGTPAAESGAGAALVTAPTGGSTPDYCKEDASVTLVENGGASQQVEVDATFVGGTDFVADAGIDEAVLADTHPASNGIPGASDTFSRQTFATITVASGDSLTVKWTITISE